MLETLSYQVPMKDKTALVQRQNVHHKADEGQNRVSAASKCPS
ncbi:MAG: hypothetical protein Q8906_01785 [Bacillota bacterium]|nr:hypothetical protein [Bacillota bacterium]